MRGKTNFTRERPDAKGSPHLLNTVYLRQLPKYRDNWIMQADALLGLIRQGALYALIKQQAFCGGAFDIDDLMLIKQQLVVFNKSIIQAIDVFAIHQMFGPH